MPPLVAAYAARADVDDASAALFAHGRRHLRNQLHTRQQVHIEHVAHGGAVHLLEREGWPVTRVVDQNVDPAEGIECGLHECRSLLGVTQIGRHTPCRATVGGDVCDDVIEQVRPARGQHDRPRFRTMRP